MWAVCDPARLRQIQRNLLTNPERYGGSTVCIGVEAFDLVHIEVVDDRPGLPREEWEPVLSPTTGPRDT